jgi:hypothetical protein
MEIEGPTIFSVPEFPSDLLLRGSTNPAATGPPANYRAVYRQDYDRAYDRRYEPRTGALRIPADRSAKPSSDQ